MSGDIRCHRCRESKPPEAFAWRNRETGRRDSMCRPCRSAYGKEHYAANRQRYIDRASAVKRTLRRDRTTLLLEYFKAHPCTDCGEADPLVLEFDHLENKSFSISRGLSDRTWQSVLEEIEKCEVVCANCHRRRTARRIGSIRLLLTQQAAPP